MELLTSARKVCDFKNCTCIFNVVKFFFVIAGAFVTNTMTNQGRFDNAKLGNATISNKLMQS